MDVQVCTGCWKFGYCDYAYTDVKNCRCPCDAGANWKHTEEVNDERKKVA